ncbi:MAG: hypothetical protein E7256_04840 [Lachnospiraceae bacterium]|nr:hypothetical protein [Lachnospiraceae bacterium]
MRVKGCGRKKCKGVRMYGERKSVDREYGSVLEISIVDGYNEGECLDGIVMMKSGMTKVGRI